jgi:hypothetical protein
MNIFSKLFDKKKSSVLNNTAIPETKDNLITTTADKTPDMDLFIDSEEPSIKTVQVQQQSKITQFLNRNYHALGVNDGHEYHSSDNLTIGKRKIGAEFRLILDHEIQEKEEKRLQLENLITDVSGVSPLTLQKLHNTLQKLCAAIDKLEKQKELSIEEEGWVMNAIYSYQQGFTQGLTDYIDSEELLNSIKNI